MWRRRCARARTRTCEPRWRSSHAVDRRCPRARRPARSRRHVTTAQAGVPLTALLQTYRIGHAVAWDAMIEAINAMDDLDRQARTDLLLVCSRYTFAYIDRVIPFVTEEYTRERDRLMLGRAQRRVQLVRDILDGAVVDGGELGYELATSHRGVIGWGAGTESALQHLAARAGAAVAGGVGERPDVLGVARRRGPERPAAAARARRARAAGCRSRVRAHRRGARRLPQLASRSPGRTPDRGRHRRPP